MRFIFTCGGTAGHINPALALAGRLRELMPDCEIIFIGAEGVRIVDLIQRDTCKLKLTHCGQGCGHMQNLQIFAAPESSRLNLLQTLRQDHCRQVAAEPEGIGIDDPNLALALSCIPQEGERHGYEAASLLQRLIEPEEIAHMVAYLASPLASATTGAAVRVDGGYIDSIVP